MRFLQRAALSRLAASVVVLVGLLVQVLLLWLAGAVVDLYVSMLETLLESGELGLLWSGFMPW